MSGGQTARSTAASPALLPDRPCARPRLPCVSGRILQPLASSPARPGSVSLSLLETSRADRNAANIAELLSAIGVGGGRRVVGHVPSKTPSASGSLAAALMQRLTETGGVELVDVSAAVGVCLSVHDAFGRRCLSAASELTTRVMRKYGLLELETVIDEEKQVSQLELADRLEDVIRNPAKAGIASLQDGQPLALEDVDSCYTPIIQSGGQGEGSEYDLRVSAQSSRLPLQYDSETAIIVQMGARYRNYCSNIARTYFINPSPGQKDVYLLLTQVYLACKQNIRPGNKIQNIMSPSNAGSSRAAAAQPRPLTAAVLRCPPPLSLSSDDLG